MTNIKKIIFFIQILLICITKVNAEIKDSLFIAIGDRAVTQSDVLNEVKIILILNNKSYSDDIRDQLRAMAIKSLIERNIKKIEVEKNDFLQFNQQDFYYELNRLASNLNLDLQTLKNICASNGLNFSIIEDKIKVELLWNSLIFQIYKNRISINTEEIEEQLKLFENKKEREEFLISEIIIDLVEKDKIETKIEELKNKIKSEGFEQIALNLSISDTAIKGGDLGWLNENSISKKFRSVIVNTPVGGLSEPIIIPEGILIFKVRDKRKIEKNKNLEEVKNELINSEKTKVLSLYSLTHYDNLRRTISVKFIGVDE